jgi:2-phospho-L-lactate/phosphoenolpyruvate guanylyltransferase
MAPDVYPQIARSSAVPAALSWSLVIPVKLLAQAKSRLAGLTGTVRSELALAMAADTIAAAAAAASVAGVLVVTDDPVVTGIATGLGAMVLPDRPAAGLNDALAYGAAYARARWPERGLAGLAGDLPAARPGELTAALEAAARLGAAFVPDADGTGTVLYAVTPGVEFRPQFGADSRNRHLAVGAVEIGPGEIGQAEIDWAASQAALAGLRRDVDTLDNLRRAAAIGLGERTRALLSADARILS